MSVARDDSVAVVVAVVVVVIVSAGVAVVVAEAAVVGATIIDGKAVASDAAVVVTDAVVASSESRTCLNLRSVSRRWWRVIFAFAVADDVGGKVAFGGRRAGGWSDGSDAAAAVAVGLDSAVDAIVTDCCCRRSCRRCCFRSCLSRLSWMRRCRSIAASASVKTIFGLRWRDRCCLCGYICRCCF